MSNEKKNDGGPAYPTNTENSDRPGACYPNEGMSLRDHFAGLAMQAIVSNFGSMGSLEGATRQAYIWADAMIEAREQ